MRRLLSLFRRSKPEAAPLPVVAPAAAAPVRQAMRISPDALASTAYVRERVAFRLPEAAPGVVPPAEKLAMDSSMDSAYGYAAAGMISEGLSFMGYPYLAELTQRPEYRRPSEILAKEMTRKWIRLQATGEDDKADRLREIEAEFKRLGVQDAFRRAAEQDGFFGRSQIYIDTGANESPEELRMPLSASADKIAKGSLKGLVVVEPIWTYPNGYNSINPLRDDFFKPSSWFVMNRQIHASRLLTFVSRDVPDLLKPAYAFGGLSLSQLAKPYIDNWLRTRQSVSDAISAFSIMVLQTDLGSVLNNGGGQAMALRAQLFNQTRDNKGLMMVNKDTEDLKNVTMPLGTLDKLQAQAQEHMAAVTGIPLVVLLGITPSGLNASSEGEMNAYFAWVESQQATLFGPPLSKLLAIVQLSLYGEIDPEIGFVFEPLAVMSAKEIADVRKTEAETDASLITAGVIDPHEARVRLAADADSAYASLDLDPAHDPEPPQQGGEGGPGMPGGGGNPFGGGAPGGGQPDDDEGGQAAPAPTAPKPKGIDHFAHDATWLEAQHPRSDNGQFGNGAGGAAAIAPPATGGPTREASAPAPGAQSFMTPALYTEAQRMIALYSKEDKGRPLNQDQKEKASHELAGHLAAAHAAKPEYDRKLADIGKAIGAEVKLAKVKVGDRLLEKHVHENKSLPDEMKDLVRGSLIVNNLDEVDAAIEAIGKNFKISRVKDRFFKPMSTGYSDILINIELPGGIQGEVQVHVPEMLAAKGDVGHALYEIERKLPEGNALKDQLIELQTRVYGSATTAMNHKRTSNRVRPDASRDPKKPAAVKPIASDGRQRSNRLRPDASHSANSDDDKASPSLPALDSFGYSRDSSDPRFSKAMHLPSGSITTGIESTSRNFEPAGTAPNFMANPSKEGTILSEGARKGAGLHALRDAGLIAMDDWEEGAHKRSGNGQFGSGGKSAMSPDHPLAKSRANMARIHQKAAAHEGEGGDPKMAGFYRDSVIPSNQRQHDKLESAFAAFAKTGHGTELSHPDGKRHAMLLPDASEQGKYRYQRFDKDGFSGHVTRDTAEEAIADAASQGYAVHNTGILDKLAATPDWDHGMAINSLMQAHNSGQSSWEETMAGINSLVEKRKAREAAAAIGQDAWNESSHERADNGQFGTGAGISLKAKKRIREFGEEPHTRVELSNGATHRIVRLNSAESMGLPGWHDADAKEGERSFIHDTEPQAINELIRRHISKAAMAAEEKAIAQDDEHWITTHPHGGGKGTPLLISGGGVVIGGAGGNLNGKTLSPSSKSAPRAGSPGTSDKSSAVKSALQNRNRNSAASIAQMNRIAKDPNPRLLMAAPTMNDGAPVVSDLAGSGVAKHTGKRDWIVTGKREIAVRYAVVEADQLSVSNKADGTKNADYAQQDDKLTAINNGRTAGVVAAYERGTADKYKTAIAKAEKVHGIPAKTIRGMKAPVLVRIMDSADVGENIGDESNSTQTLALSAVEQASNDSTRFDPTAIDYKEDGTPTDESVKGFINAMPESERQSLSPNGRPTKQAIDRMMAATFHTAYGDSELVNLMAQATDPESRNLINGMSKAAGSMAKLKDAGDLDFRELVTGAAKQIINAVRSGVSIKKYLAQGDLLTSSPESQIAAMFAENARSSKTIGEKLDAAAKFAYAESQRGGTDMFGEQIPTASRNDVLGTIHAQS